MTVDTASTNIPILSS